MKKIISVLLLIFALSGVVSCSGAGGDQSGAGFKPGVTEENVYQNKFFGMKYVKPYGWDFASEDYLALVSGTLSSDSLEDGVNKALNDGNTVYDMYCVAPKDAKDSGSNVSVTVWKLKSGFDEQKYFDSAANETKTALAELNAENVTVSVSTVLFMGESVNCLTIECDLSGNHMKERRVVITSGKYACAVSVTSKGEFDFEAVFEAFSKI